MGSIPLVQQTERTTCAGGKMAGGCAVANVYAPIRQCCGTGIGDARRQRRGLGAFDAGFVAVHCGKGRGDNFYCQITGRNIDILPIHLRLNRAGDEQHQRSAQQNEE